MKRIWHHPEVKTERRYWRSLGEYSKTPEFAEKLGREFDPALSGMDGESRENSRRDFMKVMGGVAAMAGLASCRRPLEKILPFTKHVEWVIPGKALLYATAMPRPWGATPMVVTTFEGRPTHLQGNPLHASGGGLDIFAQASVLDLYNPDRVKEVSRKGDSVSWSAFQKELRGWNEKSWAKEAGAGLAILVSPGTSPSRAALLNDLLKAYPKASLYSYAPIQSKGEASAVKAILGDGVKLLPKYSAADRVFSLDCDFVGVDAASESGVRDFMKRRAPEKGSDEMNRLYILENRYTLTGGIADHRKPIAASLIPVAAAVLAEEVGKLVGDSALQQMAASLAAAADDKLRKWIAPAAADLFGSKGKSLVLAGARHSEAVHALVLAINQALGAIGSTVLVLKVDSPVTGEITELVADLKAKKVKQLFVLAETDPIYDAPGFAEALKESGAVSVTLAMRQNHTSRQSTWVVPAAHYLESWGDARTSLGAYSIVQPMIQPLFGGVSENDLLLALLSRKQLGPIEIKVAVAPVDPKAPPAAAVAPAAPLPVLSDPSYELVKQTFTKIAGGWDEEKWNLALRDGFLPGTAYEPATGTVDAALVQTLVAKAIKLSPPSKGVFEVVLTADSSVLDGRYIDNAWLQEAPDPITKLTWDNAAWLNPRQFNELGLKADGDKIKVTLAGKEPLVIPAIACPGHASDSVTIPLGYGQTVTSDVGNLRGFDAYALRSDIGELMLADAKIEKAEGTYLLAITQENYTMEGRAQVREGTKERFDLKPDFALTEGMDSHAPPVLSLYKGRTGKKSAENPTGFDYENEHQWGMVIDLSKCIGCSACIVACQSENNIAVVGKDQVAKGRVMQWIRMDRYFSTPDGVADSPSFDDLDNPEMVNQPVACQQCESAPCEAVCPVNATVHTEEGLNSMAYNRCIGTRYCANNCPYTARRFNFFDYNKRNPLIDTEVAGVSMNNLYAGPLGEKKPQEVVQLQKNPNVTVRMRGVIEKCTYCVQRIEEAKINQRRVARDDASKLRVLADGVKTACQASCPSEAIMFGDLANDKSTINSWKASPRNYQVLKYIGTEPRTSYLARIRNVNPKMPDDRTVKTGEASSRLNAF